MRRAPLVGFGLLVMALQTGSSPVWGQALLYRDGGAQPGELGYLLGGAYSAVASGGESLWYNPAGLVESPRRRLTASGDVLRYRRITTGSASLDAAEPGTMGLAYADTLGRVHDYPRFAFGFALADTAPARLSSRFDETHRGHAADFPPGYPVAGSFDTDFPDGYRIRDTGEAEGLLRVLSPALGLAVAPAEWLRVGAALHLERVTLALRGQGVQVYDGTAAGGANTVSGSSQRAWSLNGEALRLGGTLGVQMDLAGQFLVALVWQSGTETLKGSGRVHLQRADRIAIGLGGLPGPPLEETALADHVGLPFRLDEPPRLTLGVALRTDRVLAELDVYRVARRGTQMVLPATDTQSPSTLALTLPAVRTESQGALGMAVGLAYAQSDRTSLVMGFGSHPAAVGPADGVFRNVPVTVVTAGAYHVRGDLSGSLGVVHRRATAQDVRFPTPDGGVSPGRTVDVLDVGIRTGVSLTF